MDSTAIAFACTVPQAQVGELSEGNYAYAEVAQEGIQTLEIAPMNL